MKLALLALALAMVGCRQGIKSKPIPPAEKEFTAVEDKKIEAHAKILQDEGRMPTDTWLLPYAHLTEYSWHHGKDSYFGAYLFSQRAFDQAHVAFFVHGLMLPGSDLLIAMNRNASFSAEGICSSWGDSNGNSGRDCKYPKNSPVGFHVSPLYGGPKDAVVVEVVDGRTLRLNQKATELVMQYDVAILPSGYVDLCACDGGGPR